MCGFAGLIEGRRTLSPEIMAKIAEAMGAPIAHRGPDDSHVWTDPEGGIAMAFRRLSIVELSAAGRQPMASRSGRFVVSFNGEIYNAHELRRDLAAEGLAFRGSSDTEAMVEAFERWGVGPTLGRLRGMFAIAAWDRASGRLFLIRDRLGKKPLYYGRVGGAFLFASQPKCFFAHPDWRGEIDRNALAAYLRFGYVPAPHSIFAGIRKVRPGEIVEIEKGEIVGQRLYWDAMELAAQGLAHPHRLSDKDAVDRLEALLGEAVRERLVSDVPLGAFLSGGIDSSAIVALMQAHSTTRVKTFSIGFSEAAYDESGHARAVAKHLGVDHHEMIVSPQDALDVIPTIPDHYDEPFADSSQIPTYLLCRMARQHVTVALSGDGGDELFAGYTRYRLAGGVASMTARMPGPVRHALAALIRATPAFAFNGLDLVLRRQGAASTSAARARRLADTLDQGTLEHLYRSMVGQWPEPGRVVRGAVEPVEDVWRGALAKGVPNFTRRMQVIDLLTYLPDDILVKVDRASMAVGLEARAPLLDHRVAEFSFGLPDRFGLRDGDGKWILRQMLYRHVPQALVDRPKMGFGVPIDEWLRGPLRDWAEDLLDPAGLAADGLFDPAPIRHAWEQHVTGRSAWHFRLWCVLMFQAWMRRWRGSIETGKLAA